MATAVLRKETEATAAVTPGGELTLEGKTLDDLTPEWREVFLRRHDPSFWSRPFKTAEEAMAAMLSDGDDEFGP